MFHTIEEAIEDLKAGKPIIVVDDEDRENEGDLVALAENVSPETINFMATYGRGLICTPITEKLAKMLDLYPMVTNNQDHYGTAFTVSIDHENTSTGISAFDRAETIVQLLNPQSTSVDFRRPGHIFPLIAKEHGVLKRPGHTEAAVDLAILSGSAPAGVICEIMSDNGEMARLPELLNFAEQYQLKIITIEDLITFRLTHDVDVVKKEATVNLPTEYGDFQMIGYSNLIDDFEHVAMIKGDLRKEEAPLVRLHSECLTGDIFGSKRCDCGPQLKMAMSIIEQNESGLVLYMRQEGRGIGLLNKLRAYELQEKGYDTVEANEKLGFPAEARDYAISAQILKDLGIKKVRLLTNNPDKMEGLQKYGITVVDRVSLEIGAEKENANYLATKKSKMGHLIKGEIGNE
ncbi:bifunctional 3,4-dihydroxy-2-butanone-4-phosphate synthase/GTP cyclohydrolase II [Psychrobacillus vulpis]|uniref:Riboflavin biosynthesis protein RibBA n=1 Tax=Psychrobacillus vulpis TaxID=2325572 RepID=A0A544TTM1_9BACI|nr:bifunctional 3,4-dihydroxy-2-butanone-4-phosphate synthase/GTP cyclohydrolase II [Psychrobacillus vulpis]TQR20784.1 bifunctional 3,4-dihydroxy-2-butanone-4-phosphate synthase/GTP cyclohydrolase II [Psychrobacillus vulpis]